jgi:putative transport protein
MLEYLKQLLENNPILVFFVVLGLGYMIGKVKIKGFEFGPIAGVLFVGLFFGHYGFGGDIPVSSVGFIMFIFSVGFQAGPKFFSVIRKDGLRYLTLAVVVSGTGFAVALAMAKMLGLEPGAAAGVLAGGLTSSPTLAAAQEAIRSGSVPPPEGFSADAVLTNVTTGYAITYLFGLAGLIVLIRLIPKITGVNLVEAAAQLANEDSDSPQDQPLGLGNVVVRAYEVTKNEFVGKPFGELINNVPGLVAIHKIMRGDEEVPVGPKTSLQIGDRVAAIGFLGRMKEAPDRIGPEIVDNELLDAVSESCRVVVNKRSAAGTKVTRAQISREFGCILAGIKRLGVAVPLEPDVVLHRGDVLAVTGPKANLDRFGETFGHVERELQETDLLTFALGIAVGIVVGSLSVKVGGISVGLGSAGGLLASGLTIGFLRSIHPTFGRMPEAACYVFMELGLLFFMVGVGLRAGSGIVDAIQVAGPSLFLAGVATTVLPVLTGYLVGRKLLRINPVLLLGGITGSMTSGACLSIVNKEAGSSLPALGYTGAYAFANVLLTVAGSIILLW